MIGDPDLSVGSPADRAHEKELTKLVVVESPYAGDIEQNVKYARRAVRDCLERGEAPITSHLLFTQEGILRDAVPEERELGIRAGLAWVHRADKMVVYVDYGISSGMHDAIEYAEAHHIAYEFRSIGTNQA